MSTKPKITCPYCGEDEAPLRRIYSMPVGMEDDELCCEDCFPANDMCDWYDFDLVDIEAKS